MIDYDSIGDLIGLFDLSFNEAVLIAGIQKSGGFIQSRPLVTERIDSSSAILFSRCSLVKSE